MVFVAIDYSLTYFCLLIIVMLLDTGYSWYYYYYQEMEMDMIICELIGLIG